MNPANIGNYYEDFVVGQVIYHSLSKTVFESDNNTFCLMTMNYHPLHTNADYASRQTHGQILVVGTLVFSLVVGMSVPDISGKAIANLDYENIKHLAPTFIGDTLYARTEILGCRESQSKPDRGIIYVETTGYNQNGTDVIKFRRHVLVKKRPAGEESAAEQNAWEVQMQNDRQRARWEKSLSNENSGAQRPVNMSDAE